MKRKYSNLFRILLFWKIFLLGLKKILLEMEKNPTRGGKFSYYLYIIYLARSTLSKFYQNFLSIFVINLSILVTNRRQQKILNLFYFTSKPHLIIPYPVLIFKIVPIPTPLFNSVATYPVFKFQYSHLPRI